MRSFEQKLLLHSCQGGYSVRLEKKAPSPKSPMKSFEIVDDPESIPFDLCQE